MSTTQQCPACGKTADARVAARTAPETGPLDLDTWTLHVHDGAGYYHRD